MALNLVKGPVDEPVSVAEAKLHLRLEQDYTDEDDLILALIRAAREYAETFTRRVFLKQQWQLTMDYFPTGNPFSTADYRPIDGAYDLSYRSRIVDSKDLEPKDFILLPKPRLISVESVKYYDLTGALQTMDPATYAVEIGTLPGRVTLNYQVSWPLTRNQRNCVLIDFTAGYGTAADSVPSAIIAAIKLLIGHLYENRAAVVLSRYTIAEVPLTVDALLAAHQVVEFV